jgi:hypothetical protein
MLAKTLLVTLLFAGAAAAQQDADNHFTWTADPGVFSVDSVESTC